MKKALLALVIAGTLVGGSTASYAANKTPSVKPTTAGAEGTATHESSETSTTQKNESTMTKATKVKHAKKAKPAKKVAAK